MSVNLKIMMYEELICTYYAEIFVESTALCTSVSFPFTCYISWKRVSKKILIHITLKWDSGCFEYTECVCEQ